MFTWLASLFVVLLHNNSANVTTTTQHNWVRSYQVTIANIGNVYRKRGDYLRAIEYYRCAVEYAQGIQDPVSIQKWTYNIRLSYSLLCQSIERMRSIPASV